MSNVEVLAEALDSIPDLQRKHLKYIHHHVYKSLYYAAANNGQFLKVFFPRISKAEAKRVSPVPFKFEVPPAPFYRDQVHSERYSHAPDKACSRTLKSGEPVYRCEQCGFDDTCVLCIHCFNPADHEGHNVSVYTSRGSSGGICDCGDPEAFKPLNCKCSSNYLGHSSMKPDQKESLRSTIRFCLDYIIGVLEWSVHTLPMANDSSNPYSIHSKLELSEFVLDKDVDKSSYFLVVWNDEVHDRTTAGRALDRVGLGYRSCEKYINIIHLKGRGVVSDAASLSYRYGEALAVQFEYGLMATVMTMGEIIKQEVSYEMIRWLDNLLNFNNNTAISEYSKTVISELLIERPTLTKHLPTSWLHSIHPQEGIMKSCFENGVLYDGQLANEGLIDFQNYQSAADLDKPVSEVLKPTTTKTSPLTRIQYLLLYQTRLPKPQRRLLKSLIIPTMLSDLGTRKVFAAQLLEVYPSLITIMATTDREDHLNLLPEITSQILTCPNCRKYFVENRGFEYIMGPLVRILEEKSAKWVGDYPNLIDITKGKPEDYRAIKASIGRGIRDIASLIDKVSGNEEYFHTKAPFGLLLLFLRVFQGYWPIVRKTGEHVEREILDFVIHAEYSIPVLNVAKAIGTYKISSSSARSSVSTLVDYLSPKVKKSSTGLIEFTVSTEPTSLIHPINSLLSYIIQTNGVDSVSDILENIPKTNPGHSFVQIADVSLQSLVLASQINVGFWIRNGSSVSRQGTLYFESIMNDQTYFRDFHLNQIACIVDDPTTTLLNFLSRWELFPWYSNEVTWDKTVYEDRFYAVAEKFIVFLYNLLVDKEMIMSVSSSERSDLRLKKSIAYLLCDGPASYSSVKNELPTELNTSSNFDEILYEMAVYQPPTGLVDTGMFRLKAKYFKLLDPVNLYFDTSKFQSISDSLEKNIAKAKSCKESEVVLNPAVAEAGTVSDYVTKNLGRFAKTQVFAKLVYKLLQVAIDEGEETYLYQLLHLIHAVIIDDENLHGPNHLNPSFVNIPIGDLLLTIVDSKMSARIVKKADYLLNQFLAKDESIFENLVDCFGEEYVAKFQKRQIDSESNLEKIKRLNKERQSKVMKKFEKQREKFLTKNKELDFNNESTSAEDNSNSSTCVLCGERMSTKKPFGLLASRTDSDHSWKLIPYNKNLLFSAFKSFDEQASYAGDTYGTGYHSPCLAIGKVEAPYPVLSSCGHYIHNECLNNARGNSRKHLPCPLCKTLHDLFIPTFEPPQDLHPTENSPTSNDILGKLVSAEYSKDQLELNGRICKQQLTWALISSSESVNNFYSIKDISHLIANIIQMNETATRIGGENSLVTFLTQIPGSVKTLLRSLIVGQKMSYDQLPASENGGDLRESMQEFIFRERGKFDRFFFNIIVMFFDTGESLEDVAQLGLTALVIVTIHSFAVRVQREPDFLKALQQHDKHQFKPSIEVLNALESHTSLSSNKEYLTTNDAYADLYFGLERCLLPFLRQLIIFKDLLTCIKSGENTFESSETLKNLEIQIEAQPYLDSSKALTDALGVSSLDEILQSLDSDGGSENLQFLKQAMHERLKEETDFMTIEYPGIVKLIDLPRDFNSCIMDERNISKGGYDNIICLVCAKRVKSTAHVSHMTECNRSVGIFFIPRTNNLRLCTHIGHSPPINIQIPAPYLTEHGEFKRPGVSGKALLNTYRYEYLNKMWINQGLYAFITRSLFGTRRIDNMMDFQWGPRGDVEDDDDDDPMELDEFSDDDDDAEHTASEDEESEFDGSDNPNHWSDDEHSHHHHHHHHTNVDLYEDEVDGDDDYDDNGEEHDDEEPLNTEFEFDFVRHLLNNQRG